jgi:hypothetical protein
MWNALERVQFSKPLKIGSEMTKNNEFLPKTKKAEIFKPLLLFPREKSFARF